jgi:hypothetical protein
MSESTVLTVCRHCAHWREISWTCPETKNSYSGPTHTCFRWTAKERPKGRQSDLLRG